VIGDDSDPTTEDDHLVVSFGAAAGGPTATVDMGSFGVVRQAEPVQLFTDLESIDAITDVILIADRSNHRGVAPLVGSSTRRLLAPYLLGEGPATDQTRDTPVAIVVGQFDGDEAEYPDVAALGHLVPSDSPTSTGDTNVDLTPRMFMLQGQGDGDLLGGQPMIAPLKSTDFEYRDALWATGRLDPSSKNDAIVGIDATDDRHAEVSALAPHMFIARAPTGSATDWALVAPAALPSPYNAMRVHALHLADLDADGAPDLIVEMTGPSLGAGLGKVSTSAFVAWTKNGTPDTAHASSIYPANTFCRGSAAIQADLDKPRELAAICTDTTGAVSVDVFHWDGSAWKVAMTMGVAGQDPKLVVGDFNGDLLDDLAITSGTGPSATVQVYVQCAGGDVACAAKAQLSTPAGM
jgi:hypothetical protein